MLRNGRGFLRNARRMLSKAPSYLVKTSLCDFFLSFASANFFQMSNAKIVVCSEQIEERRVGKEC